jgi:hypothetical protein
VHLVSSGVQFCQSNWPWWVFSVNYGDRVAILGDANGLDLTLYS